MKAFIILSICAMLALAGVFVFKSTDYQQTAGTWTDYDNAASGVIADADTFLFYDTGVALKELSWANLKTDIGSASLTITGTWNAGGGTLEIPNGTADVALGNAGEINLNTTDEQLSVHSAADGEISGEVAIPLLQHVSVIFDPDWAYDADGTNHNLPLFKIGDDAPEGIKIVEWLFSCSTASVSINANLYFADAYQTWGNETLIDVIDITAATSSTEDTNGSIYGGATIPYGKVIYIGFDADPNLGDDDLVVFEFWYYTEED